MKLLCAVLLLTLYVAIFPPILSAHDAPAAHFSGSGPHALAADTNATAKITEYTLLPDKLAKSKALYDLSGKLRLIGTFYGLLVLWLILQLGVGANYRNAAEKVSRNHVLQALIFATLLLLTITVLDLPLDAYRHKVGLQYGLSVQGWASWFGDQAKGFIIGLIIFIIAIWGVTKLIRKSPRRWWFYTWVCAVPFLIFLTFIAPIVIDPLFNKFEPLDETNPDLVTAIEKVTHRGGLEIPRDRMFLMKASAKVTTLNAYVTGFGPSKRVVVWDTTIQKATTPETLFVFGHEMGHYVLHHIVIGITATAIGLFVGFYLLFRIANWGFVRFREPWHMRDLSDWAAIPMLLLIFSILSLVAEPIDSSVSRQLEHNADVYGLEVTHDINADSQQVAAHAFEVMGELSLSYPYPNRFVVFWYYDHPAIPERVRFACQYDPWDKGQSPKYVK
jgi:Zn-dependent protease with chaperone function